MDGWSSRLVVAIARIGRIALAISAVGGALSLLARLEADPPPALAPDFALDEGYWLANARSLVLFGDLAPGEANQSLVTAPLFTLAAAASFRLLGVCLYAGRLPVALATLSTAALLGM